MSDIFREVEEDVRRERLEKFWKDNGDYVLTGVAILLLAIAGYVFWNKYEAGQRAKAAAQFSAAQQITDPARAAIAYARIASSAPKGYAQLAAMEEADALFVSGNRAKAIDIYKSIAKNGGPLADAARLRAGWDIADTASRAEISDWLAPLTRTNTAWSQMAREILAYSDYRAGKMAAAEVEFESLSHDFQAPNGVRQRAAAMASFLRNGAGRNFGTVPAPVTPPAPSGSPAP
ncbi:MAG TPA: tetratricopeptide repeat protein [Rhizomicrobium sp.]